MKLTYTLALLMIGSVSCFAQEASQKIDCTSPNTQSEMNYCARLDVDAKLEAIRNKASDICSKEADVKEFEGGTVYPTMLNACISEKLDALIKLIK